MRALGIICEYNPYHKGHAYQLARARADTACDLSVAVMSEYLTQRGTLAIADPYLRARAAVDCGVDLVVGLPYPYSAASAEFFALAGVRILSAMGISALHFGSECGDITPLRQAAALLYSPAFIEQLKTCSEQQPSRGILALREELYEQQTGHALPAGSNDLLAMAYLHAAELEDPDLPLYTTKRMGQSYRADDWDTQTDYPSASALRARWVQEGLDNVLPLLPAPCAQVLQDACRDGLAPALDTAIGHSILGAYRLADGDRLSQFADMDGGLAYRLIDAARRATCYEEMLSLAATKRYTDARVRRAVWSGLCETRVEDVSAPPAYVRLLAANERGCAYLAHIRKRCPLPIITKPSRIPQTPQAIRQRQLEQRLEALFALSLPTPRPAESMLQRFPYVVGTVKD